MRNEGGGFAANIYGAMPEGSIQVTSHQSLGTTISNFSFKRNQRACRPRADLEPISQTFILLHPAHPYAIVHTINYFARTRESTAMEPRKRAPTGGKECGNWLEVPL